MKNEIKRFITCHVPVFSCNFRCSYCYVGQFPNAYENGIKPFYDDVNNICKALSVERLGGVCYFNLCGSGETLLHKDLIPLVKELTRQGHYVDIITNGVLKNRFLEIIEELDEFQKNHLFIKFSFHYLELIKRKLLDVFTENVKMIKKANISISVEVTPHDELIPYIEQIKAYSMENFGALPHITVARNEATKNIELLSNLSRSEYYKTWSIFNSPLFDFKFSIFSKKITGFCYAGEYSLVVDLSTGCYSQCYKGERLGNLKDLEKPLSFRAIGKCRQPHCFNGHAFLAFGNVQNEDKVTYAQERDRLCTDGSHWLQKDILSFFSSKMYNSNMLYTKWKQKKIILKEYFARRKLFRKIIKKMGKGK